MDWSSLFVAAVLGWLVGFFWYSPWLFGRQWQKEQRKTSKPVGWLPLLSSFLLSFLTAATLSFFAMQMQVSHPFEGMLVGFYAWGGLVFTTQISEVFWGAVRWRIFCIDAGYKLISFLVMGGVIGA